MDEYWDYDDEDEDNFSFEEQLEEDMENCGYDDELPQVCYHIGSEHCSFHCPFHHLYFGEDE